MNALITASGQFGPFTSIEQLDDRWLCDGVEYQFDVIGDATIGEWVAPPPPPAPVPESVTMRQARLALLGAGKLALVDAAIDAQAEPLKSAARIEWEYSNEVQRHNGIVEMMGPALGLTSDQIDELFRVAATL